MRKTILATPVALLSLAMAMPALADYSSTVQSFNPAGYWRLNETAPVPAADIATNSGTLGFAGYGYYPSSGTVSHPTTGALVAEPLDGAAAFTGDLTRVPYNAALNPNGPFTVECWAYKYAGTGYPLAAISSLSTTANRQGWLIYDNGGNWTLRLGNSTGYISQPTGGTANEGVWYHLAGVYDGTNATLYVNGVAVDSQPVSGYEPNPDYETQIGGCANPAFTRNFQGSLDEVAIYTNALSATEILADYQNGISASPATPYEQLVLAKNPVAYYRLNEPAYIPPITYTTAANSGTLGTAADGTVYPGLYSGAQGPAYSGMGAGNLAYTFSGASGYIDCGMADAFNTTGPLTVMAWVKVNKFTKTWEAIVTKGDSAWRVHRAGNTRNLGFGTTGLSNVDQAGSEAIDDGQWHHIAAVYDGAGVKNLYVDGILDSSVAATGTLAQDTYSVLIGENAQVTGRFFQGWMDEVAFFTNALTSAQVLQIYYSANVSPIIVRQPQAPLGTIIAGAPVTLSVLASGNPTLAYQWTKGGVAIPGETATSLAFSNISTNDSGDYAVVVTNDFGSVTSSVVALSVTYPAAPAAFANAFGYPAYNASSHSATLTQVTLEFTGPLGAGGGNPGNYSIPGLNVTGARFTNLNQTVVLTTSAQTEGQLYNVTITGVTDGVGNPLANNTGQFRAWVSSPLNGIRFGYYPAEATTSPIFANTDVGALTHNSLFPDYPVLETNLWAFDSRVIFSDDSHESYGARMRGVFVPASTAKYRFYIRSDDASQLFLNPNGADPSGRELILEEPACCGDWNKYESAAYQLVGGQPYYIEMLYKEGGGGDYGKVAVRLDGAGAPPVGVANSQIDPSAITGPAIGYPYAPADPGGAVTLAGPASASVQANHPASFTVTATNPSGWPMAYQWFRNGAPITDATNSTYALMPTTADSGARFTAKVSSLGSVATSDEATLTVAPDTDAPAVAAVHGSAALNTVVVSFAEQVSSPGLSSFSIAGHNVTSAAVDSTGTNVTITFDPPLAPGQTYDLSIQNVMDLTGNNLASANATVQSFVFSRGLLQFDYFGGLDPSDNNLYSTLVPDPRFQNNSPTFTGFLTAYDSRTIFPDDSHRGYGDFIRGLFVPPADGNYIFYLKSDDSSALFLNPLGSDPIGVPLPIPALVEETSCCHGFADLFSTPQPLVAGNMYAIGGIHKEGGGGDYVQVATKLDTDTTDPNALEPIPGSMVGVLADPVGASITITQQPANTVSGYFGRPLDVDFSVNDGSFSVVNYGNPIGPWSYNAASGSWTNFGPSGCGGPYCSGLRTPVLTIRSNTPVVLSFAHRYSFEFDTVNWDGGQVRMSVNGGPFATVPSANFSANGYVAPIGGTVFGAITTTPGWINEAFVQRSAGYTNTPPALITSVAALGAFNPGDTIQLEFLASWDECSEGTEPNWEIGSVQVTGGGAVIAEPVSLTVGAESTYLGLPNKYISYFWQRDTGTGFEDIPGAFGPTYTLYPGLADSGTTYRCTLYSPGASATTDVATVTVTMPLYFTMPTATTLTLSWPLPPAPLTPTSFVLEQSPTLVPGNWTTVPPTGYQVSGDSVYITVPISTTDPAQFYRLKRQ